MKTVTLPLIASLSLLLLACNPQPQPTKQINAEPCLVRAKTGQNVKVYLNHIKTDKRADFEAFVNDVLFPLKDYMKDERQKQAFEAGRYLAPTTQNADSSWTYSFIFDPYYEGVDYSLVSSLKLKYSDEETQALLENLSACYASPQVGFGFTQESMRK